jgi:predicted nuclease of predicted toxin-antitoxin system
LLRRAGHDVVSITEESLGISDDRILARAVAEERIILTFDRDYGELIYRIGLAAAAVLLLRYEPRTPQEPAHHILRLLQIPGLIIDNRFTVADREQVRQRPLP